jgi:hypothetical protein
MPQCEAGDGVPDIGGHFMFPELTYAGVHSDIILSFGSSWAGEDWSITVETRVILISASLMFADVELRPLYGPRQVAFPRIASYQVRPLSTHGRKSQLLDIEFQTGSMQFGFRRVAYVRVTRKFGRPYQDGEDVLRLEDWLSDDN